MANGAQDDLKPAYLIVGGDDGKIEAALARLRVRGEREGVGAFETFGGPSADAAPDPDALLAAIPAMSLTASRRYLVVDAVERWSGNRAAPVIAALGALPPDLTVVFVARETSPRAQAPKGLAEAVEAAGGEVLTFAAPRAK